MLQIVDKLILLAATKLSTSTNPTSKGENDGKSVCGFQSLCVLLAILVQKTPTRRSLVQICGGH